jgi:signal transduction histidine kinase/CheY-like chemotaxis protein/ligand-binding sensor domain-containing protein
MSPRTAFKLCLGLFPALVLAASASAAGTEGPRDPGAAGRPPTRAFGDRDGLPSNAVVCLAEDRKGYVWAGTQDGAVYFNGRVWVTVDMPNRTQSNYVHAIIPASDGSVWFGTDYGVHRLSGGAWTSYDTGSGLPGNYVNCMLETVAPDGTTIWAGTKAGLARFDGERWAGCAEVSNRLTASVLCLANEPDGAVLVGTAAGLVRMRGRAAETVDARSGLPADDVSALLPSTDRAGRAFVWVGTSAGLARLEGRGVTALYAVGSALPDPQVSAICETVDAGGRRVLWVGTFGGVARFDGEEWTPPAGLGTTGVRCIRAFDSPSGSYAVWLGTLDRGVVRVDLAGCVGFDESSGFPASAVWCFAETVSAEGVPVLWTGTRQGLTRYERGRWVPVAAVPEQSSNSVYCLLETDALSGRRELVVGTRNGLARLVGDRVVPYAHPGRPADVAKALQTNIRSLAESTEIDGTRTLWVGTYIGLVQLRAGEWKFWGAASGLPGDQVRSLAVSKSSDGSPVLWAGFANHGLARIAAGGVTLLGAHSGLPNDAIHGLLLGTAASGKTVLWIGTFGAGAAILDPDAPGTPLAVYSDAPESRPRLPNAVVYQVRQDSRGRVYLFTNKGLVRLTPRSPTEADPSEYAVRTFTVEDGLPSNEFNSGASFVDHAGRIWGGTAGGAVLLDPANDVTAGSRPLVLERTLLGGKARSLAGETLSHDENNVSFEFALLSYFHESATVYRSQLVGFEDAPTDWTADPRRSFTNLPAGTYVFRAWGRDFEGNVSTPAEVAFEIRSAPWNTWWAYTLVVLGGTGLVYGGVRLRLRRLRLRNELLERRVEERTAELETKAELLRRSEEREREANRAKSVFLANMSHELRTPLNAVIGYTQLLDRDRTLGEGQRQHIAAISRSGSHLLGLINDVLSLSKIEAGMTVLSEQTFDLRRLLVDAAEMVRVRASAKGLRLVTSGIDEIPQFVNGDEGRVRQVVANLLSNAAKFTAEGTVTLRAGYDEGQVIVEVEDTGVGIAEAEMERLFEPFTQTESGRASAEGTGLGLAISRDFARLMGGDITATSTPGIGTCFRFTARLAPEAAIEGLETRRRVIGLRPGHRAVRVLVVDDNAENRDVLVKLLVPLGFEVRDAVDGAQAVDAWSEWAPHAVLMDVRMPVMDGLEATRRIRRAESEGRGHADRCVVVALSASAFEHDRDGILAVGCDDFVAKPFRDSELLGVLAGRLGLEFELDELDEPSRGDEPERPLDLAAVSVECLGRLRVALDQGNIQRAVEEIDAFGGGADGAVGELKALVLAYRVEEALVLVEEALARGGAADAR